MPATAGDVSGPLFDPDLPELRYVIEIGGADRGRTDRLRHPADRRRASCRAPPLDSDQAINIQFTSGTTGAPKGATLSHRNLLHNAPAPPPECASVAEDRLCIPVPLYHCFGMVLGVLVCLTSGATIVFPGPAFDAGWCCARSRRNAAPVSTASRPCSWRCSTIRTSHRFDLSSLRTGIAAGALCPAPMMRRMIDDMNLAEITIGYGMTETSPLSTQTANDADLETRTETVGTMLPHFEGRVIDAERRPRRARNAGRILLARSGRDDRLLEPARCDRRVDPGRLDAQRRSRDDGRARPRADSRPDQGHDHPRRREHLSRRGRTVPIDSSRSR